MADKIEWHPNGTPGPWEVDEKRDISTESGVMVAVCYQWASPVDLAAAAEAPAMVQALRECDRRLHEDGYSVTDPLTQKIIAILARIDGTLGS